MKSLLVMLGPTGVGKTEWSIRIAQKLGCPILSADSRQIYRGMTIGTAAPTEEQLQCVEHFFVGSLPPETYFSASEYEQQALQLLQQLHEKHDTVILCGGSMMYIDALCRGIDDIPTIDESLRNDIQNLYRREGLDPIRQQLKILDPVFYNQVDLKNPKRVIHALEVCLMAGVPYSSLRTNSAKERPFRIVKIGFTRDREELYERINQRVDKMVADGLEEEARSFYSKRHLNSLNTVGYKEWFDFFDGKYSREAAIDKIKQHSRNYARKQLTWFKKDQEIRWINLSDKDIDVEHVVLSALSEK
jgi:tRNA dimethylallyltransferase